MEKEVVDINVKCKSLWYNQMNILYIQGEWGTSMKQCRFRTHGRTFSSIEVSEMHKNDGSNNINMEFLKYVKAILQVKLLH